MSMAPGPSKSGSGTRVPAALKRAQPNTWGGAALIMSGVLALLWVIVVINAFDGHHLDRFGLRARSVPGLEGIVTMPFLHASAAHLLANMFPFLIIGTMVLVGQVRRFLIATAIIVLGGGLITWLIGPPGIVVGASGLIFGWLGYLLARAYFARRVGWILAAAFALFMFGGLFSGLVPTVRSDVAWQAHVAGFAAGVGAGWLLHPRRGSTRRPPTIAGRP